MDTSDCAVSAAGSQIFHPFPRLPPELRLLIWHEALPERDAPALTPYRNGCWVPTSRLIENASSSLSQTVKWEFNHQLLDQIRVKIPLADVNYEARDFAIKWARNQGIKEVFCEDRQCSIFLRPFDPMRDVMWIGDDVFDLFIHECRGTHILALPTTNIPLLIKIRHFALSIHSLMKEQQSELVSYTLTHFRGDVGMYIIVDEHPDFHGGRTKIQPRWELCDTLEGEAMVWDRRNKRFTRDLGARLFGEDSYSYDQVLESSKSFVRLLEHNITNVNLEIRAARAMRM
ncbi:hypothetical protein PITC_035250 [Penicillium italicum]|uniref:2EXR domain-containing protein n=1 Tax=Penicillium italicum TaxID=40296 RepID=A0A0A2L1B9_PENIT|nr:hypothetical protein PITC_035250 [Penicillium italicum]